MLSFKPAFLVSSFTFIKRLFSSSSLSAISVVSSTYLRLLIFLLAILIPACDSPSPASCMKYSYVGAHSKQLYFLLFYNLLVIPYMLSVLTQNPHQCNKLFTDTFSEPQFHNQHLHSTSFLPMFISEVQFCPFYLLAPHLPLLPTLKIRLQLLSPALLLGEGNGNPLQYSCLENPMDGGAWWATVHGVAKSQTQLSDFTFTFHFHALEKEMATHSSVLAWRISGTGEPGGLPSKGSHRVGHD